MRTDSHNSTNSFSKFSAAQLLNKLSEGVACNVFFGYICYRVIFNSLNSNQIQVQIAIEVKSIANVYCSKHITHINHINAGSCNMCFTTQSWSTS